MITILNNSLIISFLTLSFIDLCTFKLPLSTHDESIIVDSLMMHKGSF